MDRLLELLTLLDEDHRSERTDEELAEYEAELLETWAAVRAGSAEDIEHDSVEALSKIADGVAAARAEAAVRYDAAADREQTIAELEAQMLGDEDEAEAEANPVIAEIDPALDEEAERVAEAEAADVAPEPVLAAAPARTTPRAHKPLRRAAQSFIQSGGRNLAAFDDIAQIMIDRMADFDEGGMPGREKVRVAKIKTFDYEGAGRVLSDDPVVAHAQLTEVARESVKREAWADTWAAPITAGAGWCAPVQPLYDFFELGETQRPVHDALPGFKAARGAVSIPQSPGLSAITTSTTTTAGSTISTQTQANQVADVAKPHGVIACPTSDTVTVEAIVQILEVENLMDKAWPELVKNINRLVTVAWARYTENRVLTDIKAGSTAVTGNQNLGASRDLLQHFSKLAAGVRSRNRIPSGVLRALLPFWVIDMIRDDLMMGMQADMQFFDVDEAWVVKQLRMRGINASFYIDGTTAGGASGQIIGSQNAGKIVDFPDTIESLMFPEGAWAILDNGELDLGVVRDSTLNAQNKYQTFAESWEKVAKIGYESYVITSTTCASGASAGTETPTCTGS